jgi:hypothetical protein
MGIADVDDEMMFGGADDVEQNPENALSTRRSAETCTTDL